MRCAVLACLLASLFACGDDGGSIPIDAVVTDGVDVDAPMIDAAMIDAQPATLTLTSTAIIEGGMIADLYSCQGANISPPLEWTAAPGAAGYAIVFTDFTTGLIHSIIWDLPATTLALPENVMKVAEPTMPASLVGSKQPRAYDMQTRGYLGPCPGSMHTYRFAVYAVDANPLPGVTLQSIRTDIEPAILAHDTASGTLSATFTP